MLLQVVELANFHVVVEEAQPRDMLGKCFVGFHIELGVLCRRYWRCLRWITRMACAYCAAAFGDMSFTGVGSPPSFKVSWYMGASLHSTLSSMCGAYALSLYV